MVTKVKPWTNIPTEAQLVERFTGKAFKVMLARNKRGIDVEVFAAGALEQGKVFLRDVGKPRRKTIAATPQDPDWLKSQRMEAAIDFVRGLQEAFHQATGKPVPYTASHHNKGPFVRIAAECVELIGAQVDVVEVINELERRSNIKNKRLGHETRGEARKRERDEARKKKSAARNPGNTVR
ncbi:hypothetical protein [Bradyrhizobium sp. SZCCHNRI1002]|uniref:hypothetical protein n=1 Tax=Bradyrhizobium sp. SZCCHNRI1002 TaxID=3057274 RepID=UPI0028EE958F|nr:hypothetical protein [Bradyrhizobium sp. SZCCHNRI1002]